MLKQDKMINCVEEIAKDEIKEYFEKMVNEGKFFGSLDNFFDSIIRVEDCGNYYILWLYGLPCMNANFVFDNNGKLLFQSKAIYQLDSDNFIIIDNDVKTFMDKLYHFQFVNSKFVLVNIIENVVDIDYSDFFNSNVLTLVCYDCRMLYNYKSKKVLIPSYSNIYSDLGSFVKIQGYVRGVKEIYGINNYRSVLVSKLEYLIDKNGNLSDLGVFDFEHEEYYSLIGRGDNQKAILNSIYEEVQNKYKFGFCKKLGSKID